MIDRLAATGLRFEHGYAQPLCTPSRVQLMTGLYNSRNYIHFGLLDPKAYTFGHAMKAAGYATCVTGKWQLQGGFEGPNKFGFDEYCLWQLTRRPSRYKNPGLEINGMEVDYTENDYGPDLVSDYALDFITRSKDKPFFLYYPMMLVHSPFEATPDSTDWKDGGKRKGKGEKKKGGGEGGEGGEDAGGPVSPTELRHFADMMNYCDKLVGKLVAKLDELKLRENTLIIFTGDNGTHRGLPSRFQGHEWIGGKGFMKDDGTRVPLIANWPGKIPAGRVSTQMVDFTDIFPTLLEFAGGKVPATVHLDGHSLAAEVQGKKPADPRQWVYCWYAKDGKMKFTEDHSGGESARVAEYKQYRGGGFYDVPHDFLEQHPLEPSQLTPAQREVREKLLQVLEKNQRTADPVAPSDEQKPKKNKK